MKDMNLDDELATLLAADLTTRESRDAVSRRLDELTDASTTRVSDAAAALRAAEQKFEASPTTASATAKMVAEQLAANATKAHAEFGARLTPVTQRIRESAYRELRATVTRVEVSDLVQNVKEALDALDAAWRNCLAEGNERIEKHRNLVRKLNALRPEHEPPMPLGIGQNELGNVLGATVASSPWARR